MPSLHPGASPEIEPSSPTGRPQRTASQLKLAVKDNIDMKGVVTTAGSKRLARERAPAEKDASCLAIARQRNVQIVGKANLSEFALAPSGFNEYFGTPRKSAQQLAQAAPGRFELRFGGGRGDVEWLTWPSGRTQPARSACPPPGAASLG